MRTRRGLTGVLAVCVLAGGGTGRPPRGLGPDPSTNIPSRVSAELPGVRERSGRLLVRPLQESAWIAHGLSPCDAAALTRSARAQLDALRVGLIEAADIHVVAVPPDQSEESAGAALLATGWYEYAEPDWIVYPCDAYPDDPGNPQQWHLLRIDAPGAWDHTTGDGSVVCAFVDTGVDQAHPDLAPNLVLGYNAASHLSQAAGGVVSDINGHGTSVAGAAAAVGNNAEGGCGVGWDLRIMPVRASNYSSGAAYLSDVLYGAVWAAANGARVVSVSYAGVENVSVEATGAAIRQQYSGLLFWAAGNTGTYLNFHWDDAVVVGATDRNDVKSTESCWGRAIDVVAPGVGIYAPVRGGGYAFVDGTSYAAPLAAATAAMVWSAAPALSAEQVNSILGQTADDLGVPGRDDLYGEGRVNVRRAVESIMHGSTTEPGSRYLPAIHGELQAPGVRAAYYTLPSGPVIGPDQSTPPLAQTLVGSVDFRIGSGGRLPGCPLASWFVAVFDGVVIVPKTAIYTFTVETTESASLKIDGRRVVDNGGLHPDRTRAGSVGLEAGAHRLKLTTADFLGTPTIVLGIRGGGLGQHTIPEAVLGHTTAIAR